MKIYLASRYGRINEMRKLAEALQHAGHIITSRWVFGDHETGLDESKFLSSDLKRIATEDVEDLYQADTVISFTEKARCHSRGGRHVEFGLALGLRLRIIVVGPRENVFHSLPIVEWYPDLVDFVSNCSLVPRSSCVCA